MKKELDYQLIDYYVNLMLDKIESDFLETGDKDNYEKRKHWLKQYTRYISYLKKYNLPDYSRKSAIKAGIKMHNKFNPVTWVWGQKGNETRGYMKLYQQHFLMLAHIPLKNTHYEDYIVCDIRPEKDKITIFKRMQEELNKVKKVKEAVKCKLKKR